MKKILLFIVVFVTTITLIACDIEGDLQANGLTVEITQTISEGGVLPEGDSKWVDAVAKEVTQTFRVNPKNVVIFNFDIIDMLTTVGLDKTGITHLAYPHSNVPVFLEGVLNQRQDTNAGSLFVPDLTVLTAFDPDLIIIGGRSTGAYSTLKNEFPNADILDVSTEYGQYIEGLERNAHNLAKIFPGVAFELGVEVQTIKAEMNAVKEVAKSHEALFIMVNNGQMSFFANDGRFAVLYDEFGFLPADDRPDEASQHGDVQSHEYVKQVNPEVIFIMDRGAVTGGESTGFSTVKNLLEGTTAHANDNIYALNSTAWYIATGGFKATRLMIADFQAFLSK